MAPRLVALTVGFGLLGLFGCRSSLPSPGGESLRCGEAGACGEGLRCIEGICVFNRPPVLDPLPVKIVAPGVPFILEATATDPDNASVEGLDTLEFSWVQVNGPDGMTDWIPTPISDNPISDSLSEEGTYILELTVTDGFDVVGPVQVTVLVGNTPPTVAPFLALTVDAGTEINVQARVTDLDGQPTTVTWTQTGGGSVGLSDPYVNDVLTATVGGPDVYTFQAVANDGFVDGPPEILTVFVAPPGGAVFVSDASVLAQGPGGGPPPRCGDIVAPCTDIASALAIARTDGIQSIFVAAPVSGSYDECLNLQGDELLRGGFDPVGFGSKPELRTQTVISCDQQPGHQLGGNTELQDLTLRSSVTTPAVPEDQVAVAQIGGGAVQFTDVDFLLADCGSGCGIAGLIVNGGNAVLTRPNIGAQGSGFGSVQSFIGIGGLPGTTVEVYGDSTAPRFAGDGRRGTIVFNVPVSAFASGIGGFDANLIVEDFAVLGGLGLQLFGIRQYGGTGAFRRNVIDIEAVGSLIADAIVAAPCTNTYPQCDCQPSCSPTADPILVAESNEIRIGSVVGATGPTPCRALGAGVSSAVGGHDVSDNTVTVEGPFSFAAGVVADGPFGGTPSSVTSNTLDIAGGRTDVACLVIGREVLDQVTSGLSGIDVQGDSWTVSGNDVVTGGHDGTIAGLYLRDVVKFLGADNVFDVARSDRGGTRGSSTTGVLAVPSTQAPSDVSVFERNQVLVGGGAIGSVALAMVSNDPWTVANNFFYGGDGSHTTAVIIDVFPGGGPWPTLLHNSLHAGGQLGNTLSSRSLATQFSAGENGDMPLPTGTFLNNLLDAGSAMGRRYGISNAGEILLSDVSDNLVQIRPGVGGALPGLVLPPVYGIFGATEDVFSVVASGSGELVNFTAPYPAVEEGNVEFVDGPPSFASYGDGDFGRTILLGFDDRIALSLMNASGANGLSYFSTVDTLGVAHAPAAAVIGRYDNQAPQDIVFIEDGGAGPNTTWAMRSDPLGLTFTLPELIPGLVDPQHVVAVEGTVFIVDERGANTFLQVYPAGFEINVNTLVPVPLVGVQSVKIGEELIPFANGRPDLVFIGDDEIRVVFNPTFSSMGGLPTSFTFAPCGGSSPVDVRGGRAASAARPTLLVRCGNGDIETWSTVVFGGSFSLEDTTSIGAFEGWDWVNRSSGDDTLVISRQAPARLTVFDMVAGGDFTEGDTRVLEPETAEFTSTGSSPTISEPGFSLLGTPCPLVSNAAIHPPGGPANRDLHLENASNACADGGQLPVTGARTDDIDGLGTRDPGTDSTPAVGADEP